MTPTQELLLTRQEEIADQAALADQELYSEGKTDAAFGYVPQRNEEQYILGYAEGIRDTRSQGVGMIAWGGSQESLGGLEEF